MLCGLVSISIVNTLAQVSLAIIVADKYWDKSLPDTWLLGRNIYSWDQWKWHVRQISLCILATSDYKVTTVRANQIAWILFSDCLTSWSLCCKWNIEIRFPCLSSAACSSAPSLVLEIGIYTGMCMYRALPIPLPVILSLWLSMIKWQWEKSISDSFA